MELNTRFIIKPGKGRESVGIQIEDGGGGGGGGGERVHVCYVTYGLDRQGACQSTIQTLQISK